MRNFLLLAIGLICSQSLLAQTTAPEKELQSTVSRFFDALATFDEAGMRSEVTPDFTLLEDGLVWNLDSLIKAIQPRKGQAFSRTNHLEFLGTKQQGNVGWLHYRNTADITYNNQKGQLNWLESAVLVKENNRWKLQLLHSSPLPKPKPASAK